MNMKPMTIEEIIELGDRIIHDAFPSRTNALSDAVTDENARRKAAADAHRTATIKLADGSTLEYGRFYDLTLENGTWRRSRTSALRGCRYEGREPGGTLLVTRYGAGRMKKGFAGSFDHPRTERIYSTARVLHAEPVEPSEKLLADIEEREERRREREHTAAEYRAMREREEAAEAGDDE